MEEYLQVKDKQVALCAASLEGMQTEKQSSDAATQFTYSDVAECKSETFRIRISRHIHTCTFMCVALHFTGDLVGVEICGEITFDINLSSLNEYTWKEHGFQLMVPEGALPPGVTATVAVRAITGGSFELPEGSELIGAFYWITSTHTFQKEVTVRLQHCAIIESDKECEHFKFLIGKCPQPQLPYKFRVVDGSFTPHTHFASVSVSEFSIITVIYNWTFGWLTGPHPLDAPAPSPEPKREYMGQVWYRKQSLTKYRIAVIITQRVQTHLEVYSDVYFLLF